MVIRVSWSASRVLFVDLTGYIVLFFNIFIVLYILSIFLKCVLFIIKIILKEYSVMIRIHVSILCTENMLQKNMCNILAI